MQVSLPISIDIIANSAASCDEDSVDKSMGIFLKKTDAIQQIVGIPPETLTTLQKLADSINNAKAFCNTITWLLNNSANSSAVYTKNQIQQLFLNWIGNAPASLDTPSGLAAALVGDATFASTSQHTLNNKVDQATTDMKTESKHLCSAKAHRSFTDTKTEVNCALSAKG